MKFMYEVDPSVEITYSDVASEYSVEDSLSIEVANADARALERAIPANICDAKDCDPVVEGSVFSHEQSNKPAVLR